MQFIENLKAAFAAFLKSQAELANAVRANTEAITATRIVAEETNAASKATQKSTAYLENSERHRREQAGIRSNF